jgi:TatD DNase family protein
MELIDTHCHLYANVFAEDLGPVIQRARSEGIGKIYLPAIDLETESIMLELEKHYPDLCFAMQGLHPCSVRGDVDDVLKYIGKSLDNRRFAAIGETGLDFYWDRSFEQQQYQAFHKQVEWSIHYQLPVVIHSRNSIVQTTGLIREHQKGNLRGVFHCFNEDLDAAKKIVDLGFFLGIGGTVTYKNSKLPEVLKFISLEHIVLETDAPYLPPVPYRGKRNESSYLVYIADKLAEIKGVTREEVALITTDNANHLFSAEKS